MEAKRPPEERVEDCSSPSSFQALEPYSSASVDEVSEKGLEHALRRLLEFSLLGHPGVKKVSGS